MKIKVKYIGKKKSFAEKYGDYSRESIEAMNNNAVNLHIQ